MVPFLCGTSPSRCDKQNTYCQSLKSNYINMIVATDDITTTTPINKVHIDNVPAQKWSHTSTALSCFGLPVVPSLYRNGARPLHPALSLVLPMIYEIKQTAFRAVLEHAQSE